MVSVNEEALARFGGNADGSGMRRSLEQMVFEGSDRVLEEIKAYAGFSCIFFLVILIVLGVFFAEWRASEKDMLEQLTKLNQALAFLELSS